MSATKMKAADAPKIAKAEIEKYVALNTERLALQRQADALKKQEDVIVDRLKAYASANGGKTQSCRLFGYVLAIVKKAGVIAWKQEFVKALGADAAAALTAPDREALTVTKIA